MCVMHEIHTMIKLRMLKLHHKFQIIPFYIVVAEFYQLEKLNRRVARWTVVILNAMMPNGQYNVIKNTRTSRKRQILQL